MTFLTSLQDFLQYDFLLMALTGTILLSLVCGIISPLIVAKRYAFMGSAVSHSTLLGLATALAFYNQVDAPHAVFFVTLAITLIIVLFLARASYHQKLPSDSLIGVFFTATFALGIIIHQLWSQQNGDLFGLLFGNILLVNGSDLLYLVLLSLILFPLILFPFRRWIFFSYDEEGARISGINTARYHYGFYIILTIVIVSSIKIAGTVLINSLLLIPGLFALKFARNVRHGFILSVSFSLLTSLLGIVLANGLDLPTGATLSLTQFIFLLIMVYGRKILNTVRS